MQTQPRLTQNKEYKKRLERWIGRQWFNFVLLTTRFLTFKRAGKIGHFLGNLGFYLILRHRHRALHNINLIYKNNQSPQALREIIRRSFINAACFGWETLYLYTHKISNEEITKLVSNVEGLQHLQAAMAQGKGVIGLGAHLGNFTLIGRKLDTLGVTNTVIMRQMRDNKLESMFNVMRPEFGQRWIPKFPLSRAIKECLSWIKSGKLLMIYIDQRSGKGVKVDFMGLRTPTPTGAAVFALKTGAVVLPIVNVKDEDGYYKLIIGEEVPVIKTGDYKNDILLNTANFNQVIAKYIFRYPDQWFWFHNRWKEST